MPDRAAELIHDSPPWLTLAMRRQGTTTALEVTGELDLAGVPFFHQASAHALEQDPECLVLDLSRLDFIGAGGLRATLELARRAAAHRTRMVIIPGGAAVQRAFELSGLADQLPFIQALGAPAVPPPARPANGESEG